MLLSWLPQTLGLGPVVGGTVYPCGLCRTLHYHVTCHLVPHHTDSTYQLLSYALPFPLHTSIGLIPLDDRRGFRTEVCTCFLDQFLEGEFGHSRGRCERLYQPVGARSNGVQQNRSFLPLRRDIVSFKVVGQSLHVLHPLFDRRVEGVNGTVQPYSSWRHGHSCRRGPWSLGCHLGIPSRRQL